MPSLTPTEPRVTPRILGATAVTLAGGTLFVGGQPAQAATFTVTNRSDSGAGSLRQAIEDSNASVGADTITITATGTLSPGYGNFVITDDLTIVGPGVDEFAIDGGRYNVCDVFSISTAGVDLSISGMTITHADCDAIDMDSEGGSLTLSSVAVLDAYDNGVEVDNVSTVTITDSWFRYNGGYEGGDGVQAQNVGAVTVSGSTFDRNRYGGLRAEDASSVSVTSSTFTRNGSVRTYSYTFNGNVYFYDVEVGAGIGLDRVATVSLSSVTASSNLFMGIRIDTAETVTMTGLDATYNGDEGVYIDSFPAAASVSITDSNLSNNGDRGINLEDIESISISRVTTNHNSAGFSIRDSGTVTLTEVTAEFNDNDGISMDGVGTATLTEVTAAYSGDDGISVTDGDGATLSSVTLTRNGGDGVDFYYVQEISLSEVTASFNGSDGIEFDSDADWSDSISIVDSTFSYNESDGIDGDDVVDLIVSGVTSGHNSDAGLYVEGLYTVTMSDSTFSYNDERGVLLYGIETSLDVTDVTVEANSSYGFQVRSWSGANVTISGMSSNLNGESGLYIGGGASVSLVESTFDQNSNEGIEIYRVSGDVTLRDVETTDTDAGSLYIGSVSGSVLVESSTFTAGGDDVYISDVDGDVTFRDVEISDGGHNGLTLYNLRGDSLLERVTISGSTDDGVDVEAVASLTIVNSTITGSGESGIDVDASVGSLDVPTARPTVGPQYIGIGSEIVVSHSTITGNAGYGITADGIGYVNCQYVPGTGETCDELPAATSITVDHSVVSGNGYVDVLNESEANEAPDQGSTTVTWSLVDDGSAHAGATNVESDTPMLGALADNGGETRTMVPLAGSPVISAGNPAVTGQPATDQRGVDRVRNRIEIGAVEVDADQGALTIVPPSGAGESQGITVTVTRSGGTDGDASVTLRSSCDGTERTVSWADGESGVKSVSFPLVDNGTDDPDRTCTIEVVGATGGVDLGTVASWSVLVTDPEDAPTPTLPATGGGTPTGAVTWLAGLLLAFGSGFTRLTRRRQA